MKEKKATQQFQNHSARLFIGLGGLWLILSIVHMVYQLSTPTVEVRWETATELETAGFNLYRSESLTGDFVQINGESGLIPSKGDTVSGSSYTYIDNTVEVGKTYFYMLEEVENDSTANRYEEDIFSYQVPYLTLTNIIFTAVTVLIGLALLVTGLKENV